MFNLERFVGFHFGRALAVLFLLSMLVVFSTFTKLPDYLADKSPDWKFWLPVFRNIIPGLAVAWLVLHLSSHFVQTYYGLDDLAQARRFLIYFILGRPHFRPYILVGKGTIENHTDWIKKIGGPGGLLVFNDSAAVLERAGVITRVLGPGIYELEPFERVWETIDLTPQRWKYSVEAMSLEGIPVTCKVDVRFKIDDDGQKPTEEVPHPMTEEAVLAAVFCKWIREPDRSEPDRLMDWTKRLIISHTEGTLRSILARHPLDRLIEPLGRRAIKRELSQSLRKSVTGLGAKIISVELGNITVQDQVTQQWIDKWQVKKRRVAEALIAEGEADGNRIKAEAQAQVKLDMLQQSAEILEELHRTYGPDIPPRIMGLCLADMIKNLSNKIPYLPNDVIEVLRLIEGGSP